MTEPIHAMSYDMAPMGRFQTATTATSIFKAIELCLETNSLEPVSDYLLAFPKAVAVFDPTAATALHCAARLGHLDLAQLLLARGASPFAADNRGRLPVDLACGSGNIDLIEFLERVTYPEFTLAQDLDATETPASPGPP